MPPSIALYYGYRETKGLAMPCNCGKKGGSRLEYVATFDDGTQKVYSTQIEAQVAVRRKGGTFTARTKR